MQNISGNSKVTSSSSSIGKSVEQQTSALSTRFTSSQKSLKKSLNPCPSTSSTKSLKIHGSCSSTSSIKSSNEPVDEVTESVISLLKDFKPREPIYPEEEGIYLEQIAMEMTNILTKIEDHIPPNQRIKKDVVKKETGVSPNSVPKIELKDKEFFKREKKLAELNDKDKNIVKHFNVFDIERQIRYANEMRDEQICDSVTNPALKKRYKFEHYRKSYKHYT